MHKFLGGYMGINSFSNTTANILAKQAMATNAAAQAASEQSTQEIKEGAEGIETGSQNVGEDSSATLTEGAVHRSSDEGESSGNGGQGKQSQNQSGQQNSQQGQQNVQGKQGNLPPLQIGKTAVQNTAQTTVKEVATAILSKTDATAIDIAGVQVRSTQQTTQEITLDFSRPNIEQPARTFTTAELMMEMIRLGTESFEQGVKTQSESIKTRTQNRLLNIKEQAKEMQDYYHKVRQSNKSPIVAFFEGLGKLFSGDIQGAQEAFNTAWENGKSLLISLVGGVAALALTALTGGGAAALMIGVLALVIGTVFSDPGLMTEIVKSCGVDTSSEFGKSLVNGLCIAATVISMVLSFGSNPSGFMKGFGSGMAKLAKQFAQNANKSVMFALKETAKSAKSVISTAISQAQDKIAQQGAKLSARAQKVADASSVAIQAGGGAAQTAIGVETGIRTAEGMQARARAAELQINLDNQRVDEEKSNDITNMLMEQYRAMIETFVNIMSSLNASTINAARA